MNIYNSKPYTYLVKCIPTNQYYYGVRWANKLPAHQDLWSTYFTSSKVIRKLRDQYGDSAFLVEIRKEFDNVDSAMIWESKVLTRLKVLKDPKWINANIRGANFRRVGPTSVHTRQKMSIAKRNRIVSQSTKDKLSQLKIGTTPWNKGKTGSINHSQETIEKIRKASASQEWTQQRREKISNAKKGKPSPLKGKPGLAQTDDSKRKLSLQRKGRKWFNNGILNKISFVSPGPEWSHGRLK